MRPVPKQKSSMLSDGLSDLTRALALTSASRAGRYYGRSLWTVAKLAIRTSYEKTALGWWWLVIRPLLTAVSTTIVMHSLAGVDAGEVPYILFVLVGLAIWNLFEQGLLAATRSLQLARLLDADVPLILLPIGSIAPRLVEFCLTLGLILAVNGYFLVVDGRFHLAIGPATLLIAPAVALCLVLAVGVGLFTAVLVGNKTDLRFGLKYGLRAWFFLTPVIYPLSLVPERWRPLAALNPMTTIVELFKSGLLGPAGRGDVGHALITIPTLVLGFGMGLWFFSRAKPRPDGGGPGGEDEDEAWEEDRTTAVPLAWPAGGSSVETRIHWLVPVRQPLILISQIQRSGGTLVSRLFDDHPECFVHPYELLWGRPTKFDWPVVDLGASVGAMFEALEEKWIRKAVVGGYYSKWTERHPFLFDRGLQRRIFESRFGPAPTRQRDVLDAYLTSLFNAWLDYQGIYREPKRFVVGFIPRINMLATSRDRFWQDYPDGYLLSVIREPANWLASAQRHITTRNPQEYTVIENAIELWRQSTLGTLAAHAARPDRVIVVLFEDLIRKTEGVMRRVCGATGLTFSESLIHPTYNGRAVQSNSSFDASLEIDPLTLERGAALSLEDQSRIAVAAGDLYAQAKERFALQRTLTRSKCEARS
jgi:lipopolysaccharide transport system permease protein